MSNSEIVNCLNSSIDVAMLEAEFRKDKDKGKSNFTRSLNNWLLLTDSQNLHSRSGVWDACCSMDLCREIIMEHLFNLTSFYIKNKELENASVVSVIWKE